MRCEWDVEAVVVDVVLQRLLLRGRERAAACAGRAGRERPGLRDSMAAGIKGKLNPASFDKLAQLSSYNLLHNNIYLKL